MTGSKFFLDFMTVHFDRQPGLTGFIWPSTFGSSKYPTPDIFTQTFVHRQYANAWHWIYSLTFLPELHKVYPLAKNAGQYRPIYHDVWNEDNLKRDDLLKFQLKPIGILFIWAFKISQSGLITSSNKNHNYGLLELNLEHVYQWFRLISHGNLVMVTSHGNQSW